MDIEIYQADKPVIVWLITIIMVVTRRKFDRIDILFSDKKKRTEEPRTWHTSTIPIATQRS